MSYHVSNSVFRYIDHATTRFVFLYYILVYVTMYILTPLNGGYAPVCRFASLDCTLFILSLCIFVHLFGYKLVIAYRPYKVTVNCTADTDSTLFI